jgi:predicted RNase H-like nuclease
LPHPAIVNLFGLEGILKYKKGRISDHRLEFIKLQNYILEILPSLSPPQSLIDSFPLEISTTCAALKEIEDKLDRLIWAYVAAYWWFWEIQSNLALGDLTTGYIVIPVIKN